MTIKSLVDGFESFSRSVAQGIDNQGALEGLQQRLGQHPDLKSRVQAVWSRFAPFPQLDRVQKVRLVEQLVELMPFSAEEKTRALSLRSWSYQSESDMIRGIVEICQGRELPASYRDILDRLYVGGVRARINVPLLVKKAIEKGNWEIYDYFFPRMTDAEKRRVAVDVREMFLQEPRNRNLIAALGRFDRMFPEMGLARSAWERADLETSVALLDIVPENLEGPVWLDCVTRSRFLPDSALFDALQSRGEASGSLQRYVEGLDSYGRMLVTKRYIAPVQEPAVSLSELNFED